MLNFLSIQMRSQTNKITNQQQMPYQHSDNNIHLTKCFECRICLQSHASNQFETKLISPCKCSGSLKYVHQECLQSWISKIVNESTKKVSAGKAHIYCQLCKSKIFFRTRSQLNCKSKEQIKNHFIGNIKTFVLLMLLLLINLGFFSALLNYLLFVGFKILYENNVVLVSLIISGQVIFSIVSVVTLVCIINKYFLNKQFVVYEIVDNNPAQLTLINEPNNGFSQEKQNKLEQCQ